jgi:hypothetical protein
MAMNYAERAEGSESNPVNWFVEKLRASLVLHHTCGVAGL